MNGEQRRDRGIERVIASGADWSEFALTHLAQWCRWKKRQGHFEITLEQFKQDFLGHFPDREPHHPNCWGAITRKAAMQGLLQPTDKSTRMQLAKAHSRFAKVWRIA